MYCPHCGCETHSGRKTCPNCGGRLDSGNRHEDVRSGRLIIIILMIVAITGGGLAGFFTLRNWNGGKNGGSDEKRGDVIPEATVPPVTATPTAENQITTMPSESPAEATVPPVTATPTAENQITTMPSESPAEATVPPVTATPTAENQTLTIPSASPAAIDLLQNQSITTPGRLFEAMKQLVYEGGDTIKGVGLPKDEIFTVLSCFSYYWEGCNYSYTNFAGPFDISLDLIASRRAWKAWKNGDEVDLDDEASRLLGKAKRVVMSVISSDMTDYEKELALHDYIINNCEYMLDVENRHTGDARGFFDYGMCQCSGYADTFWLLGTMAGLEVSVVGGTVLDADPDIQARFNLEDSGHTWNLIRLDGLWYGLDLTWDDPVGDEQTCEYTYFNIPTPILSKSRTWNALSDPEGQYAQNIDNNYYLVRNYNKQEYLVHSKDEALQSAIDQIDSGGEAIISVTDKSKVNAIVSAVASDLANHYNNTIWYSSVIWEEDPIAEYLPFCVYKFEIGQN